MNQTQPFRQLQKGRFEGNKRQNGSNNMNEIIEKLVNYGLNLNEHFYDFIKELEKFVTEEKRKLSYGQIRKLYNVVEGISKKNRDDQLKVLFRARILLEYAHLRSNISSNFYNLVKSLIDKAMDDLSKVNNFEQVMEAIVAFSKVR